MKLIAFSSALAVQHFLAKLVSTDCPPVPPCLCHCDCPQTKVEKPPVVLPCPTFPTFPVPRIFPTPTNQEPSALTHVANATPATAAPVMVPEQCLSGQMLLDDVCTKVTLDLLVKLKARVVVKHDILTQSQAHYRAAMAGTALVTEEERANLAKKLLFDHDEYHEALDLLLRASSLLEQIPEERLVPEFERVALVNGRVHCEAWTKNSTTIPTRDMCAVICRQELTCVGFSMSNDFCVWFDKFAQLGKTTCALPDVEQYAKRRNGTFDQTVFYQIEMVHKLMAQLNTALSYSNDESATAAYALDNAFDSDRKSNPVFVKAKYAYSLALDSTKEVYMELKNTIASTMAAIAKEALQFPITTSTTTTTTVVTTTTTTTPVAAPKAVNWADFPNSKDSVWARRHPDCPLGPPCVCDCKCRGVPPQNFIVPPPAPAPCPPPPIPPAGAVSLPPVVQIAR